MELTRRGVIAGSLAAAGWLGACRTPFSGPGPSPVADAHLHLFNASDLPVAGFVNYVFLARLTTMPPWGAAVVDLFATFFKNRAVTVAEELRTIDGTAGAALAPTVPPSAFAAELSAAIDARTAALRAASTPSDEELRQSYEALDEAIAVSSLAASSTSGRAPTPDERLRLRSDLFRMLAEREEEGEGLGVGQMPSAGDAARAAGASGLGDLVRLIGWGYQMLQSRSRHLDFYMRKFAAGEASPRLLVNHLVDYDAWLGDAPHPQSGHFDQIRLMRRLADASRHRVALQTFAGFCPLKHAVESLARGPTSFDRLRAAYESGLIRGFKLYPPMGFLPIGNAALEDPAFDPPEPGRRTGWDLWRSAGGGAGLGAALDRSLRAFYRYCADRSVPVMAHAGPGNGAGPGYGQRANPLGWERVLAEFPLRLSLGHLVADAGAFVAAAAAGPPYPDAVWALHGSLRMVRPGGPGEVYGDLAYMPELVADRSLAVSFFRALKRVFGGRDPDLTRILYGTDWIMLGREAHSRRYLASVRAAMAEAGYSPVQQRNVLFDNAERFLRT